MNFRKLVTRSLIFYRRTHIGVLLGTAVSTAIIVGALTIGDSVRYSLGKLAELRLGKTEFVLVSETRFFRSGLADDLAASAGVMTAPVLKLLGAAYANQGKLNAAGIQVLGVDRHFWEFGQPDIPFPETSGAEAVINTYFADRLNLKVGDEFLLRTAKEELMPPEAPLSSASTSATTLRLTVKKITEDDQFGGFSLKASQVAPMTVFLPLDYLTRRMHLKDRANLILIRKSGKDITLERLNSKLEENWQLSDAGLELRVFRDQEIIELRSHRVFLDSETADAGLNAGFDATGILTYFVNEISSHRGAVPYSFISAPGPMYVPNNTEDDEIILNNWAAEDLGVLKGDRVTFKFYTFKNNRTYAESSKSFRIKSIISVTGSAVERELMPAFPGLAETSDCRDWNPGIPISLNRIRDRDEEYWNKYKGTPKGFITLKAAQSLWGNSFGNLTAIRYKGNEDTLDELSRAILAGLKPGSIGLIFRPVRMEGIQAGMGAVDFGQLFLGLSFFIIVAALILTGMLFTFSIENRSEESTLLTALGILPAQVRCLHFAEGFILACFGGILGAPLGVGYNRLILYFLSTVWKGAVGASCLFLFLKPSTFLSGALAGITAACLAMWIALSKPLENKASPDFPITGQKSRISIFITAGCVIGAAVILLLSLLSRRHSGSMSAGFFFCSGALMLGAFLSLCNILLLRLAYPPKRTYISTVGLGIRNSGRRRKRSLTTIGLLACGTFIVIAVSANRNDSLTGAERKESGTGGFQFYCETSLPVLKETVKETEIVPIRVHEGEDASCLNLNLIERPQILGVPFEILNERGSFSFIKKSDVVDDQNPWLVLEKAINKNTIPAVADWTVIQWGLHKKIGDTLTFVDEKGRVFYLKLVAGLANSIFQGSILISEKAFMERFPSTSGYRIFLIDSKKDKIQEVKESLLWSLGDYGLFLEPTARRLEEFNRVENTYLSIFLFLGGLGLVLGSIGMGIVVLRNVMESRRSLAILRAVGFSRLSLILLILSEHMHLLIAGIFAGSSAAIIAVLPVLKSSISYLPVYFIATVTASGVIWILVSTIIATGGNLLSALRNE